jgi:hypothetical protein
MVSGCRVGVGVGDGVAVAVGSGVSVGEGAGVTDAVGVTLTTCSAGDGCGLLPQATVRQANAATAIQRRAKATAVIMSTPP